ncbi:DUF4330 domain-containing protein [Herbivorax sp. ANBcel31]|uniref:DUF4330 domain-containing protein n=1 Tax=Herbivorax sp. ANBcel31 TaxID=3069754 RepID=UPI0027B64B6B|nr:DUF4330 domain-containing protein [Herbivorax sp. ANBcel31]MDQ2085619.1 DUF4330 domain-containing protein [Herbivorax sp. ANBcel31]
MIIDSKGKLFGKISIIDILILAVVIAGLAGVWHTFFRSSGGTGIGRTPDTVVFEFYGAEAPDYAVNSVKIGDLARDFDRATTFGTITDIETDDSVTYVETADGQVVRSSTPDYLSYYFTVEGTGIMNDTGTVTIGGYEYSVGRTLHLRFGDAIVTGRIYSIDKKE